MAVMLHKASSAIVVSQSGESSASTLSPAIRMVALSWLVVAAWVMDSASESTSPGAPSSSLSSKNQLLFASGSSG